MWFLSNFSSPEPRKFIENSLENMGADVGVLRVYQYLPDVFLGRYYATLCIDP